MISIEIPEYPSVEALLRACVVFKFKCTGESDLYIGSPLYAAAVNSVFNTVIDYHISAGRSDIANKWIETYDLERHPERAEFVREYALKHPKWGSLDGQQRRDWVDVVAAPYRISDEDYTKYID
ncbi:hypothetical protein IU440_11365 [Nocardia cyriacigeorgica]|uniref:hypothetical protein n=1 Tax=Nocardia cyriacigeorgica TaxID=135487 RepID=UPI0018944BE4|nr:hypothetical protein [Nocardia cyriacigeorgica]MBF6425282.1 hypothetical protein [Nocardia cyriacigeorgica]